MATEMLPLKPDVRPLQPSPAKGLVVIAAARWVDTYNMPVRSTGIEAVRGIAKKVSERGGGLKAVQSIGLYHGEDCFEVVCYLLDQSITGAEGMQEEVRRLASEERFQVEEGYFTDFFQEEIIDKYFDSIPCDLGEA